MNSKNNHLEYYCSKPDDSLTSIVESIWMVKNHDRAEKESIIVPDGKIDLFLFASDHGDFEIFISGICSVPIVKPPFPQSIMLAISFYPIAAEYIFKRSFAELRNIKQTLPADFWGFSVEDLNDFKTFCQKANNIVSSLYTTEIDSRKKRLFELIYASKGDVKVSDLAENNFWSSRQMNRYFQKWLGLSLKSYCNIIRFSSSLKQLKSGDLYPELGYGDQSHFIRQVKKFAGVKPTILNKNENDRFIQFSLMREE